MFRLSIFLLLFCFSSHAQALTFKSGENIKNSSEVSWDILSKQVGEFPIDFEAEAQTLHLIMVTQIIRHTP